MKRTLTILLLLLALCLSMMAQADRGQDERRRGSGRLYEMTHPTNTAPARDARPSAAPSPQVNHGRNNTPILSIPPASGRRETPRVQDARPHNRASVERQPIMSQRAPDRRVEVQSQQNNSPRFERNYQTRGSQNDSLKARFDRAQKHSSSPSVSSQNRDRRDMSVNSKRVYTGNGSPGTNYRPTAQPHLKNTQRSESSSNGNIYRTSDNARRKTISDQPRRGNPKLNYGQRQDGRDNDRVIYESKRNHQKNIIVQSKRQDKSRGILRDDRYDRRPEPRRNHDKNWYNYYPKFGYNHSQPRYRQCIFHTLREFARSVRVVIFQSERRPLSAIEIARNNGTYFASREICINRFQDDFFLLYVNRFDTKPTYWPAWIPRETWIDGVKVYPQYSEEYQCFGFDDPNDTNYWVEYSLWEDEAMRDRMMEMNYYLYR